MENAHFAGSGGSNKWKLGDLDFADDTVLESDEKESTIAMSRLKRAGEEVIA